jgi:DNA-binding NtrC family response regulator
MLKRAAATGCPTYFVLIPLLTRGEADVRTAESAAEALKIIEQLKPDVLLCDIWHVGGEREPEFRPHSL